MKFLKNIKEWALDTIAYRSMLAHINSKEINTESLDDPKNILNMEDIEKAKDRSTLKAKCKNKKGRSSSFDRDKWKWKIYFVKAIDKNYLSK